MRDDVVKVERLERAEAKCGRANAAAGKGNADGRTRNGACPHAAAVEPRRIHAHLRICSRRRQGTAFRQWVIAVRSFLRLEPLERRAWFLVASVLSSRRRSLIAACSTAGTSSK